MRFGEKVHELRTARPHPGALGQRLGVSFAYISKVENGKLDFGDYPSEDLIRRLAAAHDADEEELHMIAENMPEPIRRGFFETPDAFRLIARLDDKRLDRVSLPSKRLRSMGVDLADLSEAAGRLPRGQRRDVSDRFTRPVAY